MGTALRTFPSSILCITQLVIQASARAIPTAESIDSIQSQSIMQNDSPTFNLPITSTPSPSPTTPFVSRFDSDTQFDENFSSSLDRVDNYEHDDDADDSHTMQTGELVCFAAGAFTVVLIVIVVIYYKMAEARAKQAQRKHAFVYRG